MRTNFTRLNRFTLSLLTQHPGKDKVAMKHRACGWSHAILSHVSAGRFPRL
jgi:hypothetical protein